MNNELFQNIYIFKVQNDGTKSVSFQSKQNMKRTKILYKNLSKFVVIKSRCK